ncbi:MAG: hypothetical protein C5B58_15335 [Acidobacteria bacterium]|nr:MAG: hypothetical protein C5B58_15335 [Acidobacteriota bacterium]
MNSEAIEQRANRYSGGHEKWSARTYALRGEARRILHEIRFQSRAVPSSEPRTPFLYYDHLISRRRQHIREQFRTLLRNWKREVAFESSLADVLMNHNYLKIIGLGPEVLPLIFQELEREPGLWFLALESITQEDPAASEDNTGDFRRISELWLQWGRERGFI